MNMSAAQEVVLSEEPAQYCIYLCVCGVYRAFISMGFFKGDALNTAATQTSGVEQLCSHMRL